MCGIAGLVHWGGRDRRGLQDVVAMMDRAIAYRGPDGHGLDVIEGPGGAVAVLAHRRLAILDRTDRGRQPMSDARGRHWVTFNGEIYNYRDLGTSLASGGRALRSSSDTEVVIELLAADGVAALPRLRGMFAFAAFDRESGALTMARDRFGIKPLVWVRPSPDLLLFASTPQALEASGLWRLRPAPGRHAEFLAHGSVSSDGGFWQDVQIVRPGAAVTITGGQEETHTYWSSADLWPRECRTTTVDDAARVCRAAIEDSVAAHLVSDVPVAVFLSGGMDSAAIAAAARAASTGDVQSVTVTMPGSALDESAAARETARRVGTTHTEVPLGDLDLDQTLEAFIASMAQPTVDGFNTFVVARAAREAGVQVVLSGVGGDELFGGYPSFVDVPRLHALLRRWGSGVRAGRAVFSRWPSARARKLVAMARGRHDSIEDVWWAYRGVWPEVDAMALAGEDVPRVEPSRVGGHAFDVIRDLEWRQFLERQLLPDADAFTMCRALELRVPLVDHRLVDAVASAGHWPRGSHTSWKAALFSAWPDWAPPGVWRRRKQGFVLPMATWLRQALTAPAPRVWRGVAERLGQPQYAGPVRQFLDGRAHWTRVWSLYVLDRMTEHRR